MAPVAERVTAPDDSSHAIVSSVQTDLYMPESAGTVFLTTTVYLSYIQIGRDVFIAIQK